MNVFIAGISTDVGKSVVSAIVCSALKATYWKPVQSGDLDNSDTMKLKRLAPHTPVLQEAYRLTQPMSPHAAAAIDGVTVSKYIDVPLVNTPLVVEGAGGLMVPLNDAGDLYLDVLTEWKMPTILVSRHYLGSINHTLLSVEALTNRKIPIVGIVFVGDENEATESIILSKTGLSCIGRIPWTGDLTTNFIEEQATVIAPKLKTCLNG